jgi:hypothetical protein
MPKKFHPTLLHHTSRGRDGMRINGDDTGLGPHGFPEVQAAYAKLVESPIHLGLP